MEPRPFRRGNRPCRSLDCFAGHRFNGATSFQTWKPRRLPKPKRPAWLLQWSHVLSDVETAPLPEAGLFCNTPLQWSHVLSDVETIGLRPTSFPPLPASMEPRPFRRGNDHARALSRADQYRLQWSHV